MLLFAVLLFAAGVCLLVFPENAMPNAILAISVFTIIYAVVNAAVAIADKKRDAKFFFNLLGSLLALFCAIFLLIKRNTGAIDLLASFLGLIAIIDGSFKLHSSTLSKRYKIASWWVLLALSCIVIGLGFFVIKFPPEDKKILSAITGILLLAEGVQNLLFTFYSPAVTSRMEAETTGSLNEKKDLSDTATEDKTPN